MSNANTPVAVRTERVTKDLVEEYQSKINDILIKGFYPLESISIGTGVSENIEAQNQLNLLVDNILLDGVSIVVRRADDNEIIGVVVNKIQSKIHPGERSYFERFTSENITSKPAQALIQFMSDADAIVDLFEEMNVNRLLEVTFLCVLPEATGAGAAKALVASSEEVARDLDIRAMSALFSGAASQAVGKASGFRVFDTYHHSKLLVDGVPVSERLREDQQFTQVCGKVLTYQ